MARSGRGARSLGRGRAGRRPVVARRRRGRRDPCARLAAAAGWRCVIGAGRDPGRARPRFARFSAIHAAGRGGAARLAARQPCDTWGEKERIPGDAECRDGRGRADGRPRAARSTLRVAGPAGAGAAVEPLCRGVRAVTNESGNYRPVIDGVARGAHPAPRHHRDRRACRSDRLERGSRICRRRGSIGRPDRSFAGLPAGFGRSWQSDRNSDASPRHGSRDGGFSRPAPDGRRSAQGGPLGPRRAVAGAMMPAEDVADTTRHAYPASAMVGDYFRAAAGLVPVGILFATLPVGAVAAGVLGSFAAIFGAFGLRTALRHGTSVEMTDTELRARGLRRSTIHWDELDHMRLAYYSTRRDRRSGWMQLDLRAGGARVRLDSRIDGFNQVVHRAAAVAAARGLPLNEATWSNLQALGIHVPEPEAMR